MDRGSDSEYDFKGDTQNMVDSEGAKGIEESGHPEI